LVYTAHIFTEALVLEHVWSVWPPVVVRLGLAAADLVALGLLCKLAEDGALWRRLRGAGRVAVEALSVPRRALLASTAAVALIGVAALPPLLRNDGDAALVREQPVDAVLDEASAGADDATPAVDDALFEPGRDQGPVVGGDEDGSPDEVEIYDDEPVAHET
jgi:hypothetical protein